MLCKLDWPFVQKNTVFDQDLTFYYSELHEIVTFSCDHIMECMIKYAPSIFIADEYRFKSVETKPTNHYTYVPENLQDVYFSRMLEDIINFDNILAFSNNQIQFESFREKMLRYLSNNKSIFIDKYVKKLDPYVKQRCPKFTPILLEATKAGYVEFVNFLVNIGCDVNIIDWRGVSPLMSACCYNNINIIKVLMQSQAIDWTNEWMSIQLPIFKNDPKMFNVLLQNMVVTVQSEQEKSDHVFSILDMACSAGSTDIVRLILEQFPDILGN